MWWDKVLVILFLLAAVAGIACSVCRQRHQHCEGEDGCRDCPFAPSCKRKKEP